MDKGLQKTLDIAVIVSTLLLALAFGCQQLMDLDTFWHLASGRFLHENGFFPPLHDPFSYTAPEAPRLWVDLHWGFQHLLFWFHQMGGMNGLVLLNMMLVALCALWPFVFFGNSTRVGFLGLFTALALLTAANRLVLRPELLSFNLGMVMVCCLIRFEQTHHRGFLVALPLLQMLWTNSQGIFVVGPIVVGAFAVGAVLQHRKHLQAYLATGLATVAVCLINPYGLKGFLFPLTLWQRINQQEGNLYSSQIGEFLPPFARLGVSVFSDVWYFKIWLGLAALLFAAALFRKTFRLSRFLVFLALTFLAFKARRNMALFALLTLPILCAEVAPLWQEQVRIFTRPARGRIWRQLTSLGVCVFMGLQIFQIVTDRQAIAEMNLRRSGFGVRAGIHPVGAVARLQEGNIRGNIFCDMGQFGYLLWSIPDVKVAFDNRLEVYAESDLYEHLFLLTGGFAARNPGDSRPLWEAAWEDFLKRHPTDVILLAQEPSGPPTMFYNVLEHAADWALVYFNVDGMVFLNRHRPQHAAMIAKYEMPFNDAAVEKNLPPLDVDEKDRQAFLTNGGNRAWYGLMPDPVFYPEKALLAGRLSNAIGFSHIASPYYSWAYEHAANIADALVAKSIVWQGESALGDDRALEAAVSHLEAGMKTFARNPQIPYRLGKIFYRRAQNEGLNSQAKAREWIGYALKRFDEALAIDPGFFPAIAVKVEILEKLGRNDEAYAALQRVYDLWLLEPELLFQLSTAQMKRKDYSGAEKTLRRLNHLYHHQDPKIWFRLALCYARNGKADLAADAFNQARKKNRLFIAGKEFTFNAPLAPQIPKLHQELLSLNIKP